MAVSRGIRTTEDGQEQVDEEVGAAATLEEDTKRGEHDGADDLDDVAGKRVSWCYCCVLVSPMASAWFRDWADE